MPTDILPSYTFSKSAGRYRSSASGQFVARRTIISLMESHVNGAAARYAELTTALYEKRMSPAIWIEQMKTEQRRLTLQNEALGYGGWDRLTNKQLGRAGGDLKQQYAKIAGTAQDIAEGKITLAQALARASEYAGAARKHFWKAEKETVQRSASNMILIWRRLLGVAQHCRQCLDYYEDGWQLEVVSPGEACDCGGNCKCRQISKEVPASEVGEWIGTKRG